MIRLDNEVSITTSLISCAEYQLFLDEQQQKAYYQPDHWTSRHFPPGQGEAPVLGLRPSDAIAFCAWLTEHDQENWYYRLPQKSEQEKVEELRDEKVNLTAGIGYWINEGREFIWVKEEPPEWSRMIQETLRHSLFLDSQQALTYSPNLENESERYLAESLSWARDLAEARSLIDQLIRSLRVARNRIRSEEDTFDEAYKRASMEVRRLQDELRDIKQKKFKLRTQISSESGKIRRLKSDLQRIEQQELASKRKLRPRLQANQLISRFPRQPKANRHMQPHPLNVREDKVTPKMSQGNLIAEKKALNDQLKSARESKQALETDLGSLRLRETMQQTKLQQAENHKQSQKEKLDNFRARTHSFTSGCDSLLAITRIYNRDSVFSEILKRHRILNFDQVLVNINNSTLEKTLAHVSSHADNFTRKLLDLYKSNLTHIDSSTKDSHAVPTLEHLFAKTSFCERTERLINILWSYLGSLTQRRPIGRSNPVSKLMRFTVRYFAGELADHLTYWSWKKYFSEEEQESDIDQHSLDILFDISVAFAILEARIEGRLPAHEGIIVVKQRREYEQQSDELNTL